VQEDHPQRRHIAGQTCATQAPESAMLEVARMIEECLMSRWIIVCLLYLMLTVPLYAQDDTPTSYEIALERIEEARESGATDLYLGELNLITVPPEIGQLSNLQGLFLQVNQLTNLPSEIGQLNNLEVLSLDSNQLTTLPSEIGQLNNLQVLSVSGNQLTNLPSEIGQLGSLQELWLGGNQLTNLPSEIGQLGNLQVLFLYGNQLTSLPQEIRQLRQLCKLQLEANNFQHLPTAIGNLNLLTQNELCIIYYSGLYLDDNPLISPPPEVVEQGTAAVLAYLRNQAWYHTQQLIIGVAGGVGLFVMLVLGFRWKQRGGRKSKRG